MIEKLRSILSKFEHQRILVIGDIMVDEYIWGRVERISPEAPVQIVEVKKEVLTLGGAGNVIKNLRALGCDVSAASIIGNDFYGKWVLNRLKTLVVDAQSIFIDDSRPTTKKTRIIAAHQQILRLDKEARHFIRPENEEKLIEYLKKTIDKFSCILVSDYAKGVITPKVSNYAINLAKKNNKLIIVDPKGSDFSKYKGATLLTPNQKETEIACKTRVTNENSLIRSGIRLLNDLDLKSILITRGEEGMILIENKKNVYHIPTYAKEVFDVTGAGDTVLSTFGLSVSSGASHFESAKIANLAACIAVGKLGTAVVTKEEILKEAFKNNFFKK